MNNENENGASPHPSPQGREPWRQSSPLEGELEEALRFEVGGLRIICEVPIED